MKNLLKFKKIFLPVFLFFMLFSNTRLSHAADVYFFQLKEINPPNLILDTTSKPDTTLADCQKHLKTLMDKKLYTLVKDCTKVSAQAVDNTKYYFTWQEKQGGYKTEREVIGKQACEAERSLGEYPIATSCSTTSDQNNIDLFNKALSAKGTTVDPTGNVVIDSDYTLLAPIGNLTVVDKTTGVGDYLNIILMIAIGLCGALAVIMIVVRGVQYMGDESVFGKTEAKHHIMQAVLGLILALGAYAILNTINPNLVGGSLTFNSVEIELEATESIGSSKYQEITGLKLLPPSQYDSKIRQVAKTEGVPYCALRVTIQRESGSGGADRIGWDSNVRNKDIKARRDFIDSQKKYSGLTFTKKADSITDKSIMNDDKTITNTDSLGLDWRFSHGIGLTQITCQPQPGVTFETRNSLPKCPVGNYTPKQLLNPEINIEAAGKMWKQFTSSSACGGDVYKTFMAYAQGNSGCSSPSAWARQTADAKMTLYKKCLAEQ